MCTCWARAILRLYETSSERTLRARRRCGRGLCGVRAERAAASAWSVTSTSGTGRRHAMRVPAMASGRFLHRASQQGTGIQVRHSPARRRGAARSRPDPVASAGVRPRTASVVVGIGKLHRQRWRRPAAMRSMHRSRSTKCTSAPGADALKKAIVGSPTGSLRTSCRATCAI